jgi:hypothetical protein
VAAPIKPTCSVRATSCNFKNSLVIHNMYFYNGTGVIQVFVKRWNDACTTFGSFRFVYCSFCTLFILLNTIFYLIFRLQNKLFFKKIFLKLVWKPMYVCSISFYFDPQRKHNIWIANLFLLYFYNLFWIRVWQNFGVKNSEILLNYKWMPTSPYQLKLLGWASWCMQLNLVSKPEVLSSNLG